MKAILRAVLVAAGIGAFPLAASASSTQTDLSDLWWVPAEPGWGVSMNHQGSIVVITFFAYGTGAGTGRWYQATLRPSLVNDQAFSGPVYQFQSPAGSNVTPAGPVSSTLVGSAELLFDFVEQARLNFTILGSSSTKVIRRFPVATEDLRGRYTGGAVGTYTTCAGNNGLVEEPGTLSIDQGPAGTITIATSSTSGKTCTWRGTNYAQFGQMGAFTGNYTCSDLSAGVVNVYEMQVNISGFTARAELNSQSGCRWVGRVGGVRRAQ